MAKTKIIDPDGIPDNGDEYMIVNGKKVPVPTSGRSMMMAGQSMAPGGGGRFQQMLDQGMSPALAGWIGRKKYGSKKMSSWSAKGRARAAKMRKGWGKRK